MAEQGSATVMPLPTSPPAPVADRPIASEPAPDAANETNAASAQAPAPNRDIHNAKSTQPGIDIDPNIHGGQSTFNAIRGAPETVWDYYNLEATAYDKELKETWNENLNNLLLVVRSIHHIVLSLH